METAIVGLVGVVLGSVLAGYLGPLWLRKWERREEADRRRRAVVAGLQTMRVYVLAAAAIADHQDLQIRFSQRCAELYGVVMGDVAGAREGVAKLAQITDKLVRWLRVAPRLNAVGHSAVEELIGYVRALVQALDETIASLA